MSDQDTAPQDPADPQAQGPAPEALPNVTDDTAVPAATPSAPSEAQAKQDAAVDDLATVDPDHPYAPVVNDERDPDAVLDNPEAWTVQSPHAHVKVDERPGYVVTKAELPNFDKLKEAGIDVASYVSGLVVAADDEARNLIQSAEAAWKAREKAKEDAKGAGLAPAADDEDDRDGSHVAGLTTDA